MACSIARCCTILRGSKRRPSLAIPTKCSRRFRTKLTARDRPGSRISPRLDIQIFYEVDSPAESSFLHGRKDSRTRSTAPRISLASVRIEVARQSVRDERNHKSVYLVSEMPSSLNLLGGTKPTSSHPLAR